MSQFITLSQAQVTQFEPMLDEALVKIKLELSDEQKRQLLLYLDKLLTWNKAYNLTAIKQPKEALVKHIFDCLTLVPHLKAGTLLDIGTGAGLPSVIIAICQPERNVTALDSNQKKIRFIRQVISEMNIHNVTAVASRIENFAGEFEVITSRAFASLYDFVQVATPFLSGKMGDNKGYLQAMKGVAPSDDEIKLVQQLVKQAALASNHTKWHVNIVPLSVPQLLDSRHLVELTLSET